MKSAPFTISIFLLPFFSLAELDKQISGAKVTVEHTIRRNASALANYYPLQILHGCESASGKITIYFAIGFAKTVHFGFIGTKFSVFRAVD